MKNQNRNLTILLHIKGYCKEIKDTLEIIKYDYSEFNNSFLIKNSLSMDLLQIGELVNCLDLDYIQETNDKISWNQIRGIRNRLAHEY